MLLLAVAALAPLHFHVAASEFTNAVYHVACLAGKMACTNAVYTKFWNEQYHVTREDGARFDEFRAVFDELEKAAGENPPAPFLPNYGNYFPSNRIRERVLAAALAAKSGAEFRRRAARFADDRQVERLARVLDAAEKRLHPWWVSTGAAIVAAKRKGLEREIERLGVPGLARQAAAFLEVGDQDRDLYVHLIPSPAFAGNDASANPHLNHFCIEITHDFDGAAMSSVALHELTHSLYDLASEPKKAALLRAFADSPDPAAQGLYMYLNEAMATAVQLLLLERNGQHDDDPYHDPYIPRLGRAALPLVRQAFEHGGSLFEGFAAAYLAAGRKALGPDADRIAFRFSTPSLIGDEAFRDIFRRDLAVRSFVDEAEGAHFPRMHVVRLLTYEQAGPFADRVGGLEDKRGHRGFAWLRGRDGQTLELFVVGRDAEAIDAVSKKLAEWKGAIAPGMLFGVD